MKIVLFKIQVPLVLRGKPQPLKINIILTGIDFY